MGEQKRKYVPAAGYDFLTPLYDPVLRITTREVAFKLRLLHKGLTSEARRVLDLGCGTGTLLVLARKQTTAASLLGVDGDAGVLRIAASKTRSTNGGVRLVRALSSGLPFSDASFDRVFSSLMLHHLTRAEKLRTLGETLRVLRPGGSFHVADWGPPHTALMRLLSLPLRLRILDPMNRTRDNVQGRIPGFLRLAGFEAIRESARFSTAFGTISILGALRPRRNEHAAQQGAAAGEP